MKILFLTQSSPFEDGTGANQRSKFLYESLCVAGSVDVVIPVFGSDSDHVSANHHGQVLHINFPTSGIINRPNIPIRSKNYTARLTEYVNLEDYDVVVSRYVRFATKFHFLPSNRVVIDYDDAYFSISWGSIRSFKAFLRELVKKFSDVSTRLLINNGIRKFDHLFFVSERDQDHYKKQPSSILPNIPVRPKLIVNSSLPERPAILFVGLMTYQPNIDAIDAFIQFCWPHILERHPETKLLIAGKSSQQSAEKWQKVKNCFTLGFVKSLNDIYRDTTFSIAPIWSGGGSNIKILEAYMYGRSVVASRYAYEGLKRYIKSDEEILVANDMKAFSEHCIFLLDNPEHAHNLALAGFREIDKSLSFDGFREAVLRGVINGSQTSYFNEPVKAESPNLG